jgi:hypothetical protein
MVLPKSIKIGQYTYQVIFPYRFKERSDYAGQADHDLLELRISDVDQCGNIRPDSATFVVFIHEILHCIDRIYCMNRIGKEQAKEELIEALAQGITQVFVDNDQPFLKMRGKP